MGLNETEQGFLMQLNRSEDSVADLYLNTDESLKLIEWAQTNRLIILGIDGFHRELTSLTPDLSLIADFSAIIDEPITWHERVEISCAAARQFIEINRSVAVRFNFVLANKPVN
jgi:hypothetical protein